VENISKPLFKVFALGKMGLSPKSTEMDQQRDVGLLKSDLVSGTNSGVDTMSLASLRSV